MPLKFLASDAVTWKVNRGSKASGHAGGVMVSATRRTWSTDWILEATSALPGEKLTLYITRGPIGYGYWRDLLVGDRDFDARYFVYCDNPALLPLVVGPDTREAIEAAQMQALVLHVRHGLAVTESTVAQDAAPAVDGHLAVHRALASDHARVLERWRYIADRLNGRVLSKWPPVMTLLRPIGTINATVGWQLPEDPSGAAWATAEGSLATELVAERGAATEGVWALTPGLPTIGACKRVGDRHFYVHGEPGLSWDELAQFVTRAGISELHVTDHHIAVRLAGMVLESARAEAAISLLSRLAAPDAGESPYR